MARLFSAWVKLAGFRKSSKSFFEKLQMAASAVCSLGPGRRSELKITSAISGIWEEIFPVSPLNGNVTTTKQRVSLAVGIYVLAVSQQSHVTHSSWWGRRQAWRCRALAEMGLVSAASCPRLSDPSQLHPGAEGGIWALRARSGGSMFDVLFPAASL